jgi:hypothetical protein
MLKRDLKVCKFCNKTFERPKNSKGKIWAKRKYCSRKCCFSDPEYQQKRGKSIGNALRGRKRPPHVGLLVSRSRKGIKFSEIHRKNLSMALKGRIPWNKGKKGVQVAWNKGKTNYNWVGEKNPNWKGGISNFTRTERRNLMGSLKYKKWREAVLKRDNYTCQLCGINECLEVDHIKTWSKYPEHRFDISNGMTLCKICHKKYGWNYFKEENPKKISTTANKVNVISLRYIGSAYYGMGAKFA